MFKNPIICAADTKSIKEATALATDIKPYVGAIKLGLEFFTTNGSNGLQEVAKVGLPIFLDLKFFDIPNTVYEAVYAATQRGVNIITIHTLGGATMMKAAAEAATKAASDKKIDRPLIVGVTILTSMDNSDLEQIGIKATLENQVKTLAKLAKASGLDGIVCSAHEIEMVKSTCGNDFYTVVPGIRPENSQNNDQKRVTTPKKAITNGADFLVIGRPITLSESPKRAAKEIAESLN